jgi:hypothetical protein
MTHCPFCNKEFVTQSSISSAFNCFANHSSNYSDISRVCIINASKDLFLIDLKNGSTIINIGGGLIITTLYGQFKFPAVERSEEGMKAAYETFLKIERLQTFT